MANDVEINAGHLHKVSYLRRNLNAGDDLVAVGWLALEAKNRDSNVKTLSR